MIIRFLRRSILPGVLFAALAGAAAYALDMPLGGWRTAAFIGCILLADLIATIIRDLTP